MKKIFFFAAIAALALSSCSSDELVQAEQPVGDGAVVFSAYAGRDMRGTTRGTDITSNSDLAAQGGFGVYAYEQGSSLWDVYRTTNTMPNFFYNQKVESTDGTTWTYAPVKYFSNNKDARHSFFAYGPFSDDVNVVFSQATQGPAIRYNATDKYDLVGAYVKDVTKKDVTGTKDQTHVRFTFEHALSKVAFKVGYFTDEAHNPTTHTAGQNLEEGTTITVRSVKFVGVVPSQGLYSLYTGNWTLEASEEGAYEYAPTTPVTFDNNDDAVDGTAANYKPFGENIFVIPTQADQKLKVQVVYDVTTVDENNSSNNSTVTNVITSEAGYNLTKGTSYVFKLDLGLTSVKFDVVKVDEWENSVPEDTIVDLPNNTPDAPTPDPGPSNRR